MLLDLNMQNFRKHADLTLHFTPGINAIRAENEKGKSTSLEAIAYAYFGAAGLKEPIDDVVTYGVPTSKLRVEHGFQLADVQYRIIRSPKGAELYANGNDKPLVTGQKEVTKFIEGLYGTTQAMAAKLMLAKQKDMGGALAGGPTEAGKMIENLADLDLIDDLIRQVTEELPSGDTRSVQGTVDYLRGEAAPAELPDLAPLEAAEAEARETRDIAEGMHRRHSQVLAEEQPGVAAANTLLEEERALAAAVAQRTRQLAMLEEAIAGDLPAAPAPEEIDTLRAKVEQQKQVGEAAKLRAALALGKIEPHQWDEPLDALQAEIVKVEGQVSTRYGELDTLAGGIRTVQDQMRRRDQAYNLKRVGLEGKLVSETSCAFCGKDLKDVPEVQLINNPLYAELKALEQQHTAERGADQKDLREREAKLPGKQEAVAETERYLKDLKAVLTAHDRAELLYARAADFITLDRSGVPAKWTWTGPVESDTTDYAAQLRQLENLRDAATRAGARRQEQQAQIDQLRAQQLVDTTARAVIDTEQAQRVIEKAAALSKLVAELAADLRTKEVAHREAGQALALAQAKRDQLLAQADKAKAQLAEQEAQLAEMEANNLLVKKLRAARPAITDRLWSMVLAGVSLHTAKVRGEVSTITRADGRFKVNGKPVTGLSGSAEDALGLGIRLALTRTFLPNVDFLMLDEPAAACNDEREIAMLGLLATCGFDQVILVTHSEHADAFAQNVITI